MGNIFFCCKKGREEGGGSAGGFGFGFGKAASGGGRPGGGSVEPTGNPRIKKIHKKSDLDDAFSEAGGKLVVADFYANWCGPCQLVAPKIDKFADEFASKVLFVKVSMSDNDKHKLRTYSKFANLTMQVDVDENDELGSIYGISCMPTFVIFKKGKKIDEFSGANMDKLKQLIQKHSAAAGTD